MSISVYVRVDAGQFSRVQAIFSKVKGGLNKVMSSAINDTLAAVKTAISVEVRKRYNVKAGVIKATLKVHKASGNILSGSVESKGKPLELTHFGPRPSTNASYLKGGRRPAVGVSVLVDIANGRQTIADSFMVLRAKAWPRSKSKLTYALSMRAGDKRIPLILPRGPSVPTMINDPAAWNPITEQANQRLSDRIDHYVKRLLTQTGWRQAA